MGTDLRIGAISMPHRSSVPMSWRLKKHRYSITGSQCVCGKLHMPPRIVCDCGNDKLKHFTFSGRGEIISYTTVHIGPAGFENTPYSIALIKLEEGPVISGIVIGDVLEIGKKVKSVFRRLHVDGEDGLINYGFKFELI